MPGVAPPSGGIQGFWAQIQALSQRIASLETWQRTISVGASPWTAPALINSWVNQGAPWETAAYLKDPLGFVHLKGVVKSGATGTVAFVLPAGFRPGAEALYTIANGTALGGADGALASIDASGNVTISWIGAATFIGLSGITFLAQN